MRTVEKDKQVKLLADCISKSIDGHDFRWDIFFKLWYREEGDPLFFLFKKNLSVTNTQFLELFSLLTRYCKKAYKEENDTKLLFYTTDHIRSTFTEIINTLLENFDENEKDVLIDFSEMYIDIFSSSVAVDMFFGSCAVFLPHGIEVDFDKVVHDSGYIHSAGKSVYIRNIKKSRKNDFIQSIEKYLENRNDSDIPFIVYSHEDFDGYDKASSDLLERGIDQCKIYVEKMSMGSFRLAKIIQDIKINQRLNKKLLIPKAGDFHKEHVFKKESTIWLISDKSISSGSIKNAGSNRYYICYEQVLKNESPLYYFDENKPAWKSHTTIPQSLTAALINIARPIAGNGKIVDPFGGTGTTWFEVKRMRLNAEVNSSDLSPVTSLLHEDNDTFFKMPSKELLKLKSDLEAYLKMKLNKKDDAQYAINFPELENARKSFEFAVGIIEQLKKEQQGQDQEFFLSPILVDSLKSTDIFDRFIFYICLRAEIRFQGSFERKSLTFENAFKRSVKKFTEQIGLFIELKLEIEESIKNKTAIIQDSYIKTLSTYSYSIVPSLFFIDSSDSKTKIDSEVFSSFDARKIKKGSCDLIICDPPYGFNTTEDNKDLSKLYSEFIDNAISSLKQNGQLIICLPAESYTGRDLPFCTRSDIVSRQIILKAKQQNRLIYRPAESIPITSLIPPYYWESEKALRRTILHFCFQ